MNIVKLMLASLLLVFVSCESDDNGGSVSVEIPQQIVLNEASLYPEGIAFDDEEHVFYASSIAKGKISKVHLDGTIETFADSPELVSTLGMELDKANNRLLVCVTDPGFNPTRSTAETLTQLAAIAIYDLTSGERTDFIQLSTGVPHLANDLILDNDGNIYVSDSFSPNLYKVNADGEVSLFLTDQDFQPLPNSFGLNGLTYQSEDDFLILSKYDEGKLYKIPLDNPLGFKEIIITNGAIPAIDGIILTDNNTLALSSNNLGAAAHNNRLFELTSEDDWETASIERFIEVEVTAFPTTLTKVNDELYVQYSRLQALVAGNNPEAVDFPIVRVDF